MNFEVKRVPELSKKLSLTEYISRIKSLKEVPLGVNVLTAQPENYDFSPKITLLSAMENKNTMKFFNKFSSLICNCPNTNLIVLNGDKEFNLKVDEKAKYYNSDFSKIVNVLYDNCIKLNSVKSEKKFVLLIVGYTSINNYLKKMKLEDESVKTLDEFVKDTNNDSFKFLLYEADNKFENLMNSDISDILDNSNGIWIGVDYDSQSSFEMQSIGYGDNPVNPSNELIVIIKDSEPIITRYPTIV